MEVDPNSWYHLTLAGNPSKSLVGTYPYIDGDMGLVAIANSDNSTYSQNWQFSSHNSSTYLLRTKASGANGYLTVSSKNRTCEDATPIIYNSSEAEESMLWKIQPQGDETYQLKIHVGRRICYLQINENGTQMSSGNTPGLDQSFALVRAGKINDSVFSAVTTPPASRVRVYTPAVTAFASSTFVRDVVHNSTAHSHSSSSTIPSLTLSSPPPSLLPPILKDHSGLSSSAAMGIGVAVGIAGVITLLSITLLIYRCCKLQSSPSNQHYRQARLWKGFTPATPSTARTTFVETKMANIYFAELPTPATPAFMLSPPLEEDIGASTRWTRDNRISWQGFGHVVPDTPGSPPIELPT